MSHVADVPSTSAPRSGLLRSLAHRLAGDAGSATRRGSPRRVRRRNGLAQL